MLAPDTVLQSRYRIIRLLGQGGMGAVYEALDERLDTTVALKETLFTDERLRKQFEREARLLARMHHPALPRVSDHFAEGEGQFLVMQFIPGDDLSQMMTRKQGPFPADQVLTWGDQLLDALDYLHTQDPPIIHRDIKPQNLKLTGRGQIILLDFGLAKGQGGGVSVVTTSASIFGYTPNYAPLEQIQGLGTDARSDIYALSATLYHLMTAVKPPDALTRAAALVNGQPDPLAPANEISSSIGPEIAGVLARAMSQNRDQRYASAAAMREALKGTEEAATLVGRSEAATILHAPSAATLAAGLRADTTGTMLKAGETTIVRPETTVSKRRVSPWAIGAAALALVCVLFGAFYAYQRRNSAASLTASNASEQGTINSVKVEPSPQSETQAQPVSGNVNEDKKTESNPPAATESPKIVIEPAKKGEKIIRKSEKAAKSRTIKDIEANPDFQELENLKNVPMAPNTPEIYVPNMPSTGKQNVRPMGATTTRKFPDGTTVTTLPDGTRIVTTADGLKRILRPGEKLIRRRALPRQ